MFVNSYKQPNVVEDYNWFLTKIEKLELYIVEFNKNNVIKAKNYLIDCAMEVEKFHLIIIITYNK